MLSVRAMVSKVQPQAPVNLVYRNLVLEHRDLQLWERHRSRWRRAASGGWTSTLGPLRGRPLISVLSDECHRGDCQLFRRAMGQTMPSMIQASSGSLTAFRSSCRDNSEESRLGIASKRRGAQKAIPASAMK